MDEFVLAATEGHRARAEALLTPELRRDPWARLVLGEGWDGDVSAPGGPRGWAPLLYVCHSVFASAAVASELLERGADPNVTFTNEYGAMSALYGAAGVVHDPELTRVLLEAGANPDDGESLYHSTEARSQECLRLLLEHGAQTKDTVALAHALDFDRIEPIRMLLAHGADPNEGALMAHAVRRGRGPEVLRLLAEHGADLNAPGGETWRGDVPLRSPYQHAALRGATESAETLAALGADTDVSDEDRAVAALTALPETPDVDQQEAVIMAALHGNADAVIAVAGPDFCGVVGGSPEGSLLDHAAYVGDAALVRRLLAAGAHTGAALGWAAHGSGDHSAVTEALIAAGAE